MMHKLIKNTLIFGLALFIVGGTANAQEITITCNPGPSTIDNCDVDPSNTAPVFDSEDFPLNDLKPGDDVTRQIEVNNNRDEACFLQINNFSGIEDTAPNGEEGTSFAQELLTTLGDLSQRSFYDLFFNTSTPIQIATLDAGESTTIDWNVIFSTTAGNEFQNAQLEFDFQWTFQCGEETEQVLSITKTNDEIGNILSPGDDVLYTLQVSTGDEPVYNVNVIDLPPNGFDYVSGSWTANSDINGNLKGGPTTEPTYSSPGTWNLGDMEANETITLTYVTDIDEDQESGIYPDVAWTFGNSEDNTESSEVLGNEDTGFFVGTEAEVAEDVDPDVNVEVEEEESEVLGATTLPETGANNIWAKVVLGGLALGIIFVALGILKSKKIILGAVVLALAFSLTASTAHAANEVKVRLSEPESPTNNDSLNLKFVALDRENRPVTVKCFEKGPGDAVFSQFAGDKVLPAGGDSGTCTANLGDQGTYEFKATAEANGDSDTSDTVTVEYDDEGPEEPEYIEKESTGSCAYDVSYETADDGETDKVRIYRSDDTEFEANPSTQIKEENVDPDEEYEFTDSKPDCDETYYYAIIAYDDAGNRSGVVVEQIETQVTVTVSEEAEEAEPVPAGESQVTPPAEDRDGQVEGEESDDDQEGRVSAEEDERAETAGQEQGALMNFLTQWGWVIIVLIAIISGAIYVRSQRNP